MVKGILKHPYKLYIRYNIMSSYNFQYKTNNTFDKRKQESSRIMVKYNDRIPIICESLDQDLDLDKKKYLVPADLTMGQFMFIIRKRLKLGPEQALFVFINNRIPVTSSIISNMYKENKDEDGFLYVLISKESTFGC